MVDNPQIKDSDTDVTESIIRPEMFTPPKITRHVVLFFNLRYFKMFHRRVNGSKIRNFGPARRFEWQGQSDKITVLGGMIGAPLAVLIVELAMISGAEVIYSFGSAGSTGANPVEIGELVVPEIGFDETGICRDYLDSGPYQTFSSHFPVANCRAISSVNSFFRLTYKNINRYRDSNIQLIDMEAAPLNHVISIQKNAFRPLFVISDKVTESFDWYNGNDSELLKEGVDAGMELIAGI